MCLDLSRLSLLNVFSGFLLFSSFALNGWVSINCVIFTWYLNTVNCFDELKRNLTVLCLLDQNFCSLCS